MIEQQRLQLANALSFTKCLSLYAKIILGFCLVPVVVLLLDMTVHGSFFTQYLHIVTFGGIYFISALSADRVLNSLLKRIDSSGVRLENIRVQIRKLLMWIFPFQKDHHYFAVKDSPKKRQRLLQAEIEVYIQNILNLYVRKWANAISPSQTFDKEIENDLRRIICDITEKLKNVSGHKYCQDFVRVIKNHNRKLLRAQEEAANYKNSSNVEQYFKFRHPVFCTAISKEEYLIRQTVHVLKKFSANRTIADKFAFYCLGHILSAQIWMRLVEMLSDPEFILQFVSKSLKGLAGNAAACTSSPEVVSLRQVQEKAIPPVQTYKRWHSEKMSRPAPKNRHGQERSVSEASASCISATFQVSKMTLDLTGYSVREGKGLYTNGPTKETSGKISTALGGLFSATAGPLLPDNIAFKSFNKMWKSQSNDDLEADSNLASPSKSLRSDSYIVTKLAQQRKTQSLDVTASPTLDRLQRSTSLKIDEHSARKRNFLPIRDNAKRRHSTDIHFMVPDGNEDLNLKFEKDDSSVSPDYEDTGDLASAILKLRALLAERENSDNSSNESSDSSAIRRPKPDLNCLNPGDLPADGRLILNVTIPSTEFLAVDGTHRPDYDGVPLYCIHYDGIYLEKSTVGSTERNSYQYVLKHRVVKRRFKEFLNLQQRFEDCPRMKGIVKGIKGPNKWLSLPFTKQNEHSLELRRVFFEKWLETLCSQPAVIMSKEIKDFLAYGDDGSVAFVRKPGTDDTTIDRFLSKTMSGVIHSIKDALPTFDDDNLSHKLSRPAVLVPNNLALTPTSVPDSFFSGKKTVLPYKIKFEFVSKEGREALEFINTLEIYSQRFHHRAIKQRQEKDGEIEDATELQSQFSALRLEMLQDLYLEDEPTIADDLTELLAEFLSHLWPWLASQFVVHLVKGVLSERLDEALTTLITEATGEEAWTDHLKRLRRFLWGNVADMEIAEEGEEERKEQIVQTYLKKLKDLGLSTSSIFELLKTWLSSKKINEELTLSLLDLTIVYLTEEDDAL